MSNSMFLKEGEQQTDGKQVDLVAEESQLEPAAARPPPPSFDPSSPSSLLAPTSHDPSLTSTISSSSSGDLVAAQIAQIFSLVGRLSSENEALKASASQQSTTISSLSSAAARLSSEAESNTGIRRQLESKVLPGGLWVREKLKEGEAFWVWSKDKHRFPSRTVKNGPPTSLLSLPDELLRDIFLLATKNDRLQLIGVSFRLLGIVAPILYRNVELSNAQTAMLFVRPRISPPNPLAIRITPFLLPQQVTLLRPLDEGLQPLLRRLTKRLPTDPIPIQVPRLQLESRPRDLVEYDLLNWSPLLRLLDPVDVVVIAKAEDPLNGGHPSWGQVTDEHVEEMEFLASWRKLRSVASFGENSVLYPMGQSPHERSLFEECFERANDGGVPELELWERIEQKDGSVEEKLVVDVFETLIDRRPLLATSFRASAVLTRKEGRVAKE